MSVWPLFSLLRLYLSDRLNSWLVPRARGWHGESPEKLILFAESVLVTALWQAPCKIAGSAFPGSNPGPATSEKPALTCTDGPMRYVILSSGVRP